jgi:hypothetical protein
MKVIAITVIGLGLLTASAAVRTTRPASNQSPEPTLKEVRAATERFRDVKVALAEGYVRDPGNMCDAAEMMGKPKALGVMGIHYVRPDLLGITGPPNPRVNGPARTPTLPSRRF